MDVLRHTNVTLYRFFRTARTPSMVAGCPTCRFDRSRRQATGPPALWASFTALASED